jgi:hypothetical protein
MKLDDICYKIFYKDTITQLGHDEHISTW